MTLDHLLSHMGLGTKHLSERFSRGDYGGVPAHDPHVVYSYEPSHSPHTHVAASKHHYSGGGHKSNAAMSALTLLSFLFFLHILQQCLRDHTMAMTTPPVMIMTAGREGEESISKVAVNKIDKAGKSEAKMTSIYEENADSNKEDEELTKIETAEHNPKTGTPKYTKVYKKYGNRSLEYRGFVNAMELIFIF